MKKLGIAIVVVLMSFNGLAQDTSSDAKKLLDEVSTKMGAYKNMSINFSETFKNEAANIKETDEPPINGKVSLAGEKYNLLYLGNQFIFDGKTLYAIDNNSKDISTTEGDFEEEDGFILPSKLLTFYKEGYTYQMGELENVKGRKIQYVDLTPIDSESSNTKVKLGIDARTKHIYKLIQIGTNGAEKIFTITKFKSNQAISENLFTFDKAKYEKKGYQID